MWCPTSSVPLVALTSENFPPNTLLGLLTPWYDKLMKIKQSPYQKLRLFF